MQENIEKEMWLERLSLNSKLQTLKNKARCELSNKGLLKNGAFNDFDNYEYFSEAQYKLLFTGLLSKNKLELRVSEVSKEQITGTEKQPFGFIVTFEFELLDIETGYSEISYHSGVGYDKGDKAYYKARTGALKTYFAMNFLVATQDDPEKEEERPKAKAKTNTISPRQKDKINELFKSDQVELNKYLTACKKKSITELTTVEASAIIKKKMEAK